VLSPRQLGEDQAPAGVRPRVDVQLVRDPTDLALDVGAGLVTFGEQRGGLAHVALQRVAELVLAEPVLCRGAAPPPQGESGAGGAPLAR